MSVPLSGGARGQNGRDPGERIAVLPSKTVYGPLCAAVVVLPALTACSGDQASPAAASSAPSAIASAAPSSHAPPPLPQTAGASSPPAAPRSTAAAPKPSKQAPPATPGTCGTVTAASGTTLYVYDNKATPCADAMALVKKFHQAINGRQAAGSNNPVNATVDGWLCVSGPPAAQGGTTCSKGEQTVLAAVVPAE
ncbi:hypothetical protein SAMN05421854_107423 [Amycolatopsis rubida]|uniref:Uncharacterized protein n=1 Tax=Amycolatopsis rubida TaxID=112413 RepID=A0A1I5U6Q8_9PSEU|nr:hypothetical protein SAMN05421854_107423 [Amycolatopsis rubida]